MQQHTCTHTYIAKTRKTTQRKKERNKCNINHNQLHSQLIENQNINTTKIEIMSSFTEEEKEDTMVPFKSYFSIRNSYVEDEVTYIRQFVTPDEEWVATEKVHGCNFSATTE